MEPGTIVEYIDRKAIVCAVVLREKQQRLHVLTESDREVSYSEKRLAHVGGRRLDLSMGRDDLVASLRTLAAARRQLQNQIDVEGLWEILHTEPAWIDLRTMAEFCFNGEITGDHTSAVLRALFEDRLYFKFDTKRFFPRSPDEVARTAAQAAEETRRTRLIEEGGRWVKEAMESESPSMAPDKKEVVEILKAFHLFENESQQHEVARAILERAGLDPQEGSFRLLVKVGVWSPDENLNLHRFGISETFPPEVIDSAKQLVREQVRDRATLKTETSRTDLTDLPTMTIDGQGTLDYDDAISIERTASGCRLGIHITDLGHLLPRGEAVDEEAMARASSIYMPDKRIPMLPPFLAEDLFSLKADQQRLAITIMAELDHCANVISYEILPSIICVERQLTYYEANLLVTKEPDLLLLYEVAKAFRRKRLNNGALQLTLPEINVWLDEQGEITIAQINRESPSRVMVSESMILANWLAASFFRDHGQPTVFRSQLPPRSRLIGDDTGTLYQNWMQRRHLSRVVLGVEPAPHAGLGLDAYVTLTSPLRKYIDLVTQRQLRALLGLGPSYSEEELSFIIQAAKQPMSYITVLQQERSRYWILRYLERLVGQTVSALVLERRRQKYVILLPDYMIECFLPLNSGPALSPEQAVQVRIERVDARADRLSVCLA